MKTKIGGIKFGNMITICVMLILSLASCNNSASKDGASASDKPVLTNKGVGELKFGTKYSDIPKSIDGLYDRYEMTYEPDEFLGSTGEIRFYDQDGLVMKMTCYGEETLEGMVIYTPKIDTKSIYKVGGSVKDLAANKVPMDRDYMGFQVPNYYITVTGMTSDFDKKHQECYAQGIPLTLEESDYNENSKIESITAGSWNEWEE